MFTQMGTSGNLPFVFFIITITITTDITMLILTMPYPYTCTRYTYMRCVSLLFYFWPHASYNFYQKDEPGRGRTCNLQIRSLTRFHCATGPSYSILLLLFYSHSYPDRCHIYPFLTLSLVGSYQVGYTRSHPNTEVKMLRACSVPLCSHRWERQVIYLLFFLL